MNSVVKRGIVGVLIILIIIIATISKNPYLNISLFGIIFLVASYELNFNIFKQEKFVSKSNIFISLILYVVSSLNFNEKLSIKYVYLSLILIYSSFVFFLFIKNYKFKNIKNLLINIVYITIPFSIFNYINWNERYNDFFDLSNKFSMLLIIFIFIWISDTMSYISGVIIGKNIVFKKISPKKTLEGYIGGIIATMLSAYVLYDFFKGSDYIWFFLGLGISICAPIGDLIESAIKRNYNLKDSGNILPGHGGVLDRFDSIIFVAPLFVLVTELFL